MQSITAKANYKNAAWCFVHIAQFEGISTFWRGSTMRLCRLTLSGAVIFTVVSGRSIDRSWLQKILSLIPPTLSPTVRRNHLPRRWGLELNRIVACTHYHSCQFLYLFLHSHPPAYFTVRMCHCLLKLYCIVTCVDGAHYYEALWKERVVGTTLSSSCGLQDMSSADSRTNRRTFLRYALRSSEW